MKMAIRKNNLFTLLLMLILSTVLLAENPIDEGNPKHENPEHSPLMLILLTIPKSGTHLVQKILTKMTGLESIWGKTHTMIDEERIAQHLNSVWYISHAPFTVSNYEILKNNKFKMILLFRDPRDVLVSYARWSMENPAAHIQWHYGKREPYANLDDLKSWSLEQMITHFIEHYPFKGPTMPECTNYAEFYNLYLPWQNYPDCYVTTFEKLVSPQGGGDKITQENEIMKIAQFLNISFERAKIEIFCSELFGGTYTFREGRINGWKNILTDQHKKALKALPGFNDLLVKLNYEKDDTW